MVRMSGDKNEYPLTLILSHGGVRKRIFKKRFIISNIFG
jgi:hypothetical protein